MYKIISGLLSLIFLCVFTAPLGLAATKKTGKAPARKTASKTVTSRKTGKAVPAARQKTVLSKGKNNRIISLRNSKRTPGKLVALNRRDSRSRTRGSYKKVSLRRSTPVIPRYSFGDLAGLKNTYDPLSLKSNAALVLDESNLEILFEKNSNIALPMASITKLMTGLVVVESMQDMNEVLEITEEDVDTHKHTSSRLKVGTRMTRGNLLHLALMSSENRAAAALGRNYPGGISAFVNAMNIKAQVLGMSDSHYVDSSGLSSGNVASARDLAKLVMAAAQHPILRKYSTDTYYSVDDGLREMHYGNTNGLVHNPDWHIRLQKTGYISEAGQCLVMQAIIKGRPIVMVFLDSKGKGARLADAQRIRSWLTQSETGHGEPNI